MADEDELHRARACLRGGVEVLFCYLRGILGDLCHRVLLGLCGRALPGPLAITARVPVLDQKLAMVNKFIQINTFR